MNVSINFEESNLKNQVITLDGSDWFAQWSYTIENQGDRIVVYEQHKGHTKGCFWTEPHEIYFDCLDGKGLIEVAQLLKKCL